MFGANLIRQKETLASEARGASRMRETRPGMVTVAESGSGPYSQLMQASRHVLSLDEAETSGGHDVDRRLTNTCWPNSAPAPP